MLTIVLQISLVLFHFNPSTSPADIPFPQNPKTVDTNGYSQEATELIRTSRTYKYYLFWARKFPPMSSVIFYTKRNARKKVPSCHSS